MQVLDKSQIPKKDLVKHHTKREALLRFAFVVVLVVAYGAFMVYKYGASHGLLVTALTWAFFVLCTPVADAGFLIAFPLRIILRVRMLISEVFITFIAVGVSVYALTTTPSIYEQTQLLKIFKHILTIPYPFWGIIIISTIGTFFSIIFGDELLDTVHHHERTTHKKHRHIQRIVITVFVITTTVAIYHILLNKLGVSLPI